MLGRYAGSAVRSYAADEDVPLEGVVPPAFEDLVVSRNGATRVDRVGYEVCVLNALRDALRRREVWVVGADAPNLTTKRPTDAGTEDVGRGANMTLGDGP